MKIHIAQKDETLWKIAKKYGVNFEELKKMNAQLSNPDMIMPGMKIKVPTAGGAVKPHVAPHSEHHHHAHVAPHSGHHHHAHVAPKAEHHHHAHVAPKAEHHHHPHAVKKEMPKAEHPFIHHKEAPMPVIHKEAPMPVMHAPKEIQKEIIKEKIIKEKPYTIYQPVMPQPMQQPEIDINNYYMMNMQQMQTQVQAPPPPPPPAPLPVKEEVMPEFIEESLEMPAMPAMPAMPVMPVQPYCPPLEYCYMMPPVMPMFNPCHPFPHHMMPFVQGPMGYPHHMMPQVQGAMAFPTMPMAQPMPTMMPGMPVEGFPSAPMHWGEESSSFPQMSMQQPGFEQFGGTGAVLPAHHMAPIPYTGMPMQAPMAEGFPGMPSAVQGFPPMGVQGDCGCGSGNPHGGFYAPFPAQPMAAPMPYQPGQFPRFNPYQYGPATPEAAGTYAMPVSNEDGSEDE